MSVILDYDYHVILLSRGGTHVREGTMDSVISYYDYYVIYHGEVWML